MGIIFWWMLLIWIVLIGGYWLVRWLLLRRWQHDTQDKAHAVPIAHSERLTELTAYKVALKKYRQMLSISFGLLSLALLSSILLTSRPSSISVITPAQESRDIMLCLDVSGSLLRVDSIIVNRFTALANNFTGQRIGMTVFNSSSVGVIPVNNDYQFIKERLASTGAALRAQKGQAFTDLTSGTLADFDKGTSLVGDGLASCIGNLGDNPQNRSQSVILATDNEVNGTQIISLAQATGLAEKRNIRVYAIDPGQSEPSKAKEHEQLQAAVEKTGGGYYKLKDANTINSIISEVSKQEAKYFASIPVVASTDNPKPFMYIILLTTIATLVFTWRLKL